MIRLALRPGRAVAFALLALCVTAGPPASAQYSDRTSDTQDDAVDRSADVRLVQGSAFAQDSEPAGPQLRILSEDATSVTVELVTDWSAPLSDVVRDGLAAGADPALLALRASGGRLSLSQEIDLGAAVPPAVQILAQEVEEVPLSAASRQAFGDEWLAPAAQVVNVGTYRRQLVGSLDVRPVRVEGDRLIRVRRLVVRVARPALRPALGARGGANPHVAVTRSVLADGTWYKVPVAKTGVFRITTAWLRDSLGVASPNLAQVAVYGNGGRRLPVRSGAARPADLAELPSVVAGDAVLFYTTGPSWWDWLPTTSTVAGRWVHDINPFSRVAYVFVRVDAPAPTRLAAGAFPNWTDAQALATVDARLFYEVDRYNHPRDGGGSGLDWMGPTVPRGSGALTVLDTLPPGLAAGTPVEYRTRIGSRTKQSSTVAITAGGVPAATVPISAVFPFDASNVGDLLRVVETGFAQPAGASLGVSYRASGGGTEAETWLDWVEAVAPRSPQPGPGGVLTFPTPGGQAGRFEVALGGFANTPQVWDVTPLSEPRALGVTGGAGAWRVQVETGADSLHRELVAFDPAGADVQPLRAGTLVPNQNLHGLAGSPAYVVVTHPQFEAEARRLADHRQATGLPSVVVTTDQVFNEFASGMGDMAAVRDYVKFLYDRAATPADAPGYLLMVGDGHYDYRNLRSPTPTFVPVYETENMISRTNSYTSDDFYGLLDDDEGDWNSVAERMDIAVGRLPVQTVRDARVVVDKIFSYESADTRGPWRQRFTYVADDQYPNTWDRDVHVLNADYTAEEQQRADSTVTLQKIYAPSYPAVNAAGGLRRPQMNDAIVRAINEGTLVWNYSGHGGPEALGDEKYFTQAVLDQLDNADRLPLFITATCSFGRYDMAETQSLAEEVLFHEGGGSVAMLTTVRVVYTGTSPTSGDNFGLNVELAKQLVIRDPDGRPRRMGDALLATKNTPIGASINNRKFNLLGDPALRLGLPEGGVQLDLPPTLTAYEEATVGGTILTPLGQPDLAFDGAVDLTVFDAERVVEMPLTAPCNRDFSPCTTGPNGTSGQYRARTDRIYSGRASVRGGRFTATFRVPQDVSYSGQPARIVAYAQGAAATATSTAGGASLAARVGVQPGTPPDDNTGPQIRLFVGDTTFVSGGIAPRAPVIVARLQDASGINTVGAGVGHELLLTLDGDPSTAIDVGRYYTGDLDTYRSGTVRFPLPELSPGPHTATLTAWDALNNASTAEVSFVVTDGEDLVIRNAYPYPNPTAGPTRFTFEHNMPGATPARLQIRIFTLAGRPVRTLDGDTALPGGLLTAGIVQVPWDGTDADGVRLATGIYLYRLRLDLDDGSSQSAEQIERLAIIR